MRAEVKYIDGEPVVKIYDEDNNHLSTFNAFSIDDEYHFAVNTPFTGNTIIHSRDHYERFQDHRNKALRPVIIPTDEEVTTAVNGR